MKTTLNTPTRIKNHMLFILIALLLLPGYSLTGSVPGGEEITDNNITAAVEAELLFNTTTPSNMINVMTDEGIVTLSGSVGNILAKDRAAKVARSIKGVKGVVNLIEVDAPERTDNALKQDVHDALLFDPATDSYEVEVEVNEGVVMLTGTVDSWQEKQLCSFVARGVEGVTDVVNQVTIDTDAERDDYEIMQEVKEVIDNDIRVDNALIEVAVDNGRVTLSGTVGSETEKFQAISDAWVNGVRSVNAENLEVESWARDDRMRKDKYVAKSDSEVKDAILKAFYYDPRVKSFNPGVEVNNGVVTLSGSVDNLKAKRSAEEDARNVVGVFAVENNISVDPGILPSDKEIKNNVRSAMIRDPYVENFEVNIGVENGIVTLKGTVDTFYEKIQAEDVASRVRGVVTVDNDINVLDDYDYSYYNYYGWNTSYPPYYFDFDRSYKTDVELKEDINNQLWWSPYVNQDEVTVVVENGRAILTGTVDTEREKLFAEINAIEAGAMVVDNNLSVEYGQNTK